MPFLTRLIHALPRWKVLLVEVSLDIELGLFMAGS